MLGFTFVLWQIPTPVDKSKQLRESHLLGLVLDEVTRYVVAVNHSKALQSQFFYRY
jgi:hypothetical protein